MVAQDPPVQRRQASGMFGERFARTFRGAAAQALSRVIMMVLPLVTIPLTINYLGHERFGMWMAISSLSALFAVTEGGISNALITPVAQANALRDDGAIRRLLASAMALIVPVAVVIGCLALCAGGLVPWRSVLNLKSDLAVREAAPVFQILGAAVAISFVSSAGLKMRRGLHHIAAVATWETLGALLAVPALLAATVLKLGTPWLAAALLLTPQAVNLFGLAVFFARRRMYVPSLRDVERAAVRRLMRSGAMFLTASLASAVVIGLDPMFIAKVGSAEDVSQFAVAQRLFGLPFVLANFWFYSQWPIHAEALHRGEIGWVRSSFLAALGGSAAMSAAIALTLVAGFGVITKLWIGTAMHPGALLLWSMAAYSILTVVTGACSMLIYALEARREQTVIMALTILCVVPLKIALLHLFLPAGAVLATVIVYLAVQVIPFAIIIPRRLRARQALAV